MRVASMLARADPARRRLVVDRGVEPRALPAAPSCANSLKAGARRPACSGDKMLLVPLLPLRLMGGRRLVIEHDELDIRRAAGLGLDTLDDGNEVEVGVIAVLHGGLALGAHDESDEFSDRIHVLRLGADAETFGKCYRALGWIDGHDRFPALHLGDDGTVLIYADLGVAGKQGLI